MAPCHTRRPGSVTEQRPLTPVRVAAGSGTTVGPPANGTSARPHRRDRFRNPASRRQRCQPSERGVSSSGGRPGRPSIGGDSSCRAGYRSVSSPLVWRSSSSVPVLPTVSRASHPTRRSPSSELLRSPSASWVGGSPSVPSTGGSEALVDGVGITEQERRRVPSLGPRDACRSISTPTCGFAR